MVAHLLRLRLLLHASSLKRSAWQVVGLVFGGLYGLLLLGGAVIGLIALAFAPLEIAQTTIVLGGAAVVLGWLLLPIILNGIDETLDPARLAVYPIPMPQLLVGLTLAGIVGIPGVVTLIASLATIGTWIRNPLAAVAAAVCAIVAVLTCVVGSRAVAAAASGFGTRRRTREIMGVIVFIPLLLLGPLLSGIGQGLSDAAASLPSIAGIVAWTPLGAVWSVPADIVAGNPGVAALRFAIALVTLAALVAAWRYFLADALVNPRVSSGGGPRAKGLGLFGKMPGTPLGAVAARALTYWFRDPRYVRSLIIAPLLPVLFYFYYLTNGNEALLVASGPVVALALSLSIYSDVSMDNTAFALHVSSGVSGVADRGGRVIAVLAFAVPILVLIGVGTVAVTNTWVTLPALIGLSFGILFSGLGIASVVSARVVFPAPLPGDSPFKSPPGAGAATLASSFASWGILAVIALPEIVLGIIAIVTGSLVLGFLNLFVGLVLGTLFMVIGIRWGGRILDRRAPDLLQQLMRQR